MGLNYCSHLESFLGLFLDEFWEHWRNGVFNRPGGK
jgi:hypothetical protein